MGITLLVSVNPYHLKHFNDDVIITPILLKILAVVKLLKLQYFICLSHWISRKIQSLKTKSFVFITI